MSDDNTQVEQVEQVEEVETKQDDLAEVREAVDAVAAENAEVKAQNEELEAKSADLENKLAEAKALNEELEAKAQAPAIHISKDEPQMEDNLFKTFLTDGIEGLRQKGTDLQISTDAQGGYALPEELRQEIIRLEHEVSPLRREVSVASASTTDVQQLVSVGDAASGWVGETTARTQTNAPELAQRTATFGEVYARPRVYQHMLEDAFYGVEAWLTQEVARQFAEVEGVAFLSGDGTNKPVGILNGLTLSASSAANDTTGAYEVIESATDGALAGTDAATIDFLRSVVLSVKTGYLPGAKWMMNRATHDVLAQLKDSNGNYYINRNIAEAAGQRLFGHDIVINEDMDSIPTSTGSNAVILFGDFKRAFQVVDRVGVSMMRDPYTNPGSVMFYTRKRVGSMVLDASALKVVTVSKV